MGYERVLSDEIDRELHRLQEAGQKWVADWITQTIIKRHEPSLNRSDEDSEFWRHCAYANVRDAVRRRINGQIGDKPDHDDQQMKLPGYEHLQEYYIVKRLGEGEIGVPIADMTDDEINEKVVRYETMGAACIAHAEELRRFRDGRKARRRSRKK